MELAQDLEAAHDLDGIEAVLRQEQQEVTSVGIRFAIYSAEGRMLAGEQGVHLIDEPCATVAGLRTCSSSTTSGARVLAATLREPTYPLLVVAALAAASLAGMAAWALGRVLSARAVSPLVRLQTRIANVPLEGPARSSPRPDVWGDAEGVSEVDELRTALSMLLGRMNDAIDRSVRFAANAAHELRTPLTALRAELELAAEAELNDGTRLDPSRSGSIEVALRKVSQLQSLTERLLTLATPDGGADGFEVVSLRDVIDDVVATLPASDRARVTIADDDDVFVRGDSETLGIAVSNGLSNALKFGAQAFIEVSALDDHATVAIEDDGPGIPADERGRMFEPFARARSTKGVPGHGLGLALVEHVATCHRGHANLIPARHGRTGARLEIVLPIVGDGRRA